MAVLKYPGEGMRLCRSSKSTPRRSAPYCWRAKRLLETKGVEYKEIAVDFGGEERRLMIQRAEAGRPSLRSSSASIMSAAATTWSPGA